MDIIIAAEIPHAWPGHQTENEHDLEIKQKFFTIIIIILYFLFTRIVLEEIPHTLLSNHLQIYKNRCLRNSS